MRQRLPQVRTRVRARLGAQATARVGVRVTLRARDQRGVIAIEFLLVISTLIVVFLLMLQYAVKAHAQQIASAAAQEGLAAASSYDGTAAQGRKTAHDYLTQIGPGLTGSHVAATRTAISATVTISGRVEQLVPFLGVSVSVHVEGPVEHFVATPRTAPVAAGPSALASGRGAP